MFFKLTLSLLTSPVTRSLTRRSWPNAPFAIFLPILNLNLSTWSYPYATNYLISIEIPIWDDQLSGLFFLGRLSQTGKFVVVFLIHQIHFRSTLEIFWRQKSSSSFGALPSDLHRPRAPLAGSGWPSKSKSQPIYCRNNRNSDQRHFDIFLTEAISTCYVCY